MESADLRALIVDAAARDLIPAQPLIDVSPGPGAAESHAALFVDLTDALKRATAARARSLDIYADMLVLSPKAQILIADPMMRLTVIARRIVFGEGAKIVLDHSAADSLVALRIAAGEVEGTPAIFSKGKGAESAYDTAGMTAARSAPAFTNFAWDGAKPVVGTTVVPPGLLARGQPLHRTLAATFQLAAGTVASRDEEKEILALGHAMLRWIASWTGLESDLAQIARVAEDLRRVLPKYEGDSIVRPIPPLTAAAYLSLAGAYKDLAKEVELDAKLIDQAATTSDVAKAFVKANLKRDDADGQTIEASLKAFQSEIDSIDQAIDRAARALRDRQLDQELDEIALKRAQSHDRIDKIVEASFQIAIGLVTLATSIAAICVGVPADPTASAKKDIQGVQGLFDALKATRQNALLGPNTAFTELLNVLRLYALPVTFAFANAKDHKDSIKSLATSSLEIKSAASAILGSGGRQKNFDAIAASLGEAMRTLATAPTPLDARAAWDALEVEAVNALDVVINDSKTAGSVKQAAADYKTAIQKVAIYGRLMAEQQARKDATLRAMGALALQRLAQMKKQASYESLAAELTDRQALAARIRAETEIRQDEAARAFFQACYGLRRAQFYETYTTPKTAPALPRTGADIETVYAQFASDLKATSGLLGRVVSFNRDIRVEDPAVLADFAAGKTVPILLGPDRPELARLWRIRLTGVEAWLEGEDLPKTPVGIELISSASFGDRNQSVPARFSGETWRIPFEYEGVTHRLRWTGAPDSVMPTPFSDWLVTLYMPESVATPSALRLSLAGTAFG